MKTPSGRFYAWLGLILSSFASGVNREVVRSGCEMLGMELDAVIRETIEGMKAKAAEIGLKGTL